MQADMNYGLSPITMNGGQRHVLSHRALLRCHHVPLFKVMFTLRLRATVCGSWTTPEKGRARGGNTKRVFISSNHHLNVHDAFLY